MTVRIILAWLGLFGGSTMAMVCGMSAKELWRTKGPKAKVYLVLCIIGIIAFIGGWIGLLK